MKVIFIHGPAASGKHTIGTLLSEQLNLPLFHNHLTVDLVKTLFDFGTEAFVSLRAQIWLAAFSSAAESGQSFIFTFHPESTVNPKLIEELDQIIHLAGGNVEYVQLRCSDKAVVKRINNESRSKFGKLVDPMLYKKIRAKGGFEFPPLPRATVIIDTERLSAEEAAIAIASKL